VAEFNRRLLAIVQRLEIGPLLESQLNELIHIRRRRLQPAIVFDQIVYLLPVEAQHVIERHHRGVGVVLRVQ
jgi:hypothetical protein